MKKILILPLLMLSFGVILTSCQFIINSIAEDFSINMGAEHDVDFINKSNDIVYVSVISSSEKNEVSMKSVFERAEDEYYSRTYMIKIDADSVANIGKVYDTQIEDRWYYQLVIISQHTLDSYSKEEIIEKNIYDNEIVMRCTKLKAMDFKVVYTGDNKTERM